MTCRWASPGTSQASRRYRCNSRWSDDMADSTARDIGKVAI
jgi:hypothetical protein